MMMSAVRSHRLATVLALLALLAPCGQAAAGPRAKPEKPLTLPDVRAIARKLERAVVRVETFEHFLPGVVRRAARLLNPFPLSTNVGDAASLIFYLPSGVFYGLRKHLGSGVLFDRQGYILTNYHVVRGADEITVRLTDAKGVRHAFDAALVGRDLHVDVALLKIDPGDAPIVVAPLGDSEKMRLGDWIIAIGNPMRLTGTVTCGIVSGLHRQVGQNLIEDFIQVDAAVNPGNSGGPILNTDGEVVGIVDLGMFPANNIGFAIPTSLITPFLDDMKKHGRPRRGYLGVTMRDLAPELAKRRKLDVQRGVIVTSVAFASPAARAGIRRGDLVLAVGGKKVGTARDAQMAVLRTHPGQKLPITVRRRGQTLQLTPTLAPRRAPLRIL